MNTILRKALYSMVVMTFFTSASFASALESQGQTTEQAISYLVSAVVNSHLTFIRNGERHTSEEAVKHMMDKYTYFKSKVKTPEDFINLCASKSLFSGKPYLVETPHGVVPTQEWLTQVLAKYRESNRSCTPTKKDLAG